jgi:hypothetical protein
MHVIKNDLFKARPHKYIKREKRGDKWVYWYKLPDGRIVSSDEEGQESKHKGSIVEHAQRLVAGALLGKHSMTTDQMARHLGHGYNVPKVDSIVANFYKRGKKVLERRGEDVSTEAMRGRRREVAILALNELGLFSEDEMAEAHADPSSKTEGQMSEYEERANRIQAELDRRAGESPAPRRTRSRSPSERHAERVAEASATEVNPEISTTPEQHSEERLYEKEGGGAMPLRDVSPGPGENPRYGGVDIDGNFRALSPEGKILGATFDTRAELDAYLESVDGEDSEGQVQGETRDERVARLKQELKDEFSIDLDAIGEESAQEAQEEPASVSPATQAQEEEERTWNEAIQQIGRDMPLISETPMAIGRDVEQRNEQATDIDSMDSLEVADPEFAQADEAITAMVREQAHGGNPYLRRAKEIFERIQDDLKPERRQIVNHIMQAIEELGSDLNEQSLFEKYKQISGRRRIRGLSGIGADFGKAAFMTLDEVINNPPVDVEVQRMKHGYPMKQFLRMKPHLKSSFLEQSPSAPPPFPTFGDLKGIRGDKPAYVGPNNRTSMPEAVYNSLPRDTRGNAIIPPAWCPIHLMPAWNYMVKQQEKKNGGPLDVTDRRIKAQVYGGDEAMLSNNQATYDPQTRGTKDGNFVNALRKYVKFRGEGNLVDIPKSALSSQNLTHDDIFKSEEDDMQKILTTKIIDNAALMPFIKEEMKKFKKSFSLYVDLDAPVFRKSSEEKELKKSLIKKIREIRCKNDKKNYFVPNANRK